MKLSNKIFLALILFCSAGFVFAQDCKTKLTVQTDLDSSRIYLNSKFVGKGKVTLELEKGSYKLLAREPSVRWDAKVLKDSLNLTDCGKELTINLDFKKLIYLQTDPQDAYVYTDDSLIGNTPLFIPVKDDSLILKKPGYEAKPVSLADYYAGRVIKLNYTGIQNGESFFQKSLFKILVGSIVALGTVTAYFKLKADDKFGQYQSTGDNSLLDQTRKYDLISGITLGALEINFGFLMYYFLTD